MKAAYRTALILSLAAFGATSLEAAEINGRTDEVTNGIRVVNNYGESIRVYAEDAAGRIHSLGRVARGELVEFEIPEGVREDSFRLKIYPAAPVWAMHLDDFGVKTNPLDLHSYADVTVWVEPQLTNTVVELQRS